MKKFNLIILAGGEKGPLFEETGMLHKAMVPIHGKPMLDWVIDSFHESERIEHVVVVGDSQLEQLASMRYVSKRLDSGLNVLQNLMSAVGYIKNTIYQNQEEHNGYLLSFCDAVFLTPQIIEDTLEAIAASEGDIVLHYVEKQSFMQMGLPSTRTYIPVDGKFYTGTTIYYIRKYGLIMNLATKLFALRKYRKEPAKLFEILACGEKTLPAIQEALSREAAGQVKILVSPHPGLGMDVDNPADLNLARQFLTSPWRHAYRKCMVIYNPQSGQSAPLSPLFREILGIKQKKFEIYDTQADYTMHILEYLKEYGISAEARPTDAPGHATEIARQCATAEYDLVIAVGGDGTVNEVANGLVGSRVTLGVIPLGTVNVLGLQMKLPPEIKAACQVIAAGRTRTIDLGKIEDRYFVSMAGVGFDAHVVRRIDSRLKRIYGALAFAITAFKQFLVYRFKPIILKIDDQPIPRKGYFVIIGNGKYYGGDMIVATYADISDGYLDVCIFKHKSLFRLLTYFFWMRRGRIDRDLSVEYFQCKKISILKSGRHAVHVDAEYLCKSPVEIRICPGALTLAV